MYFPLNYASINWLEGQYSPSAVKSYNNVVFNFWERNLFQRLISVINFKLPEEWAGGITDFFYYCLLRNGFVCVSENERFGKFFQPCAVYGFNFYYQPTTALIANPRYSAKLKIGEECELLKLTPDFFGCWDIITYYAEKLSLLDNAINMNIVNSKMAYVITGKNKAAVHSLEQMIDKINQGYPTVAIDQRLTKDRTDDELPIDVYTIQKVKENYVVGDQLRDFQTILNNFMEEIGVPTLPYEKKERMTVYESQSRVDSSMCKLQVWKKSLDASLDAIHKLYPDIDISYEFNFGGDADGKGKTDADGNVLLVDEQ